MTGRSGRGIGLRARQWLAAAREGIRNAEERRNAEEDHGTGVPVQPAARDVPGVAGVAPAKDGATVNGAAAHGAPHPLEGPLPDATGRDGGIVPHWLEVAGGWAWRLLFIGIVLYLAYRVAGRWRWW